MYHGKFPFLTEINSHYKVYCSDLPDVPWGNKDLVEVI